MTTYKHHDTKIELTKGDIVKQSDMDAVVNAANAMLMPGGGVAGAIHRAAGPELAEECRDKAPIKPGQAVVSGGHKLPNPWVIHCLGPVYGHDEPSDKLLADCYRNALQVARENGITSVAFPAISTGAFGYPVKEAADVTATAIVAALTENDTIQQIRFVLFDDNLLDVFQQAFDQALGR
ncbi:MAG: macro domain-containing protein [Pseudomonadales bacterium]